MKTLYRALSAMALISGLSSCHTIVDPEPDPQPEAVIEIMSAGTESVTFSLSANQSSEVAWYCCKTEECDVEQVEASQVFADGTVLNVADTPKTVTVENLEPETSYTVFSAARYEDIFSPVVYAGAVTGSVPAPPEPVKLLSVVGQTKNSITYKVDAPADMTWRHSYIEGWYYDLLLEQAKNIEGEEFNMSVFLWNLLADYGLEDSGSQTIQWISGQEDPARGRKAHIVGGHKYYALMSPIKGETEWLETPEAVAVELDPAGDSPQTVKISADLITHEQLIIRMECDEKDVNFFYYDLYPKNQFDEEFAKRGVEGMKEYLYEYGYVSDNTYTDAWAAQMGTEYVLALMGVDHQGDTFFKSEKFETPVPDPEIHLSMSPYERELEGYYGYNTLRVVAEPAYFSEFNPEQIMYWLVPKDRVTEMLGYAGMTLDDLRDSEKFLSAYQMLSSMMDVLPEKECASLEANGYFESCCRMQTPSYYDETLSPDTEYCYILAIGTETGFVADYVVAKTDPEPVGGAAEAEYKAYLGNWTVLGQSTRDWKTEKTYNLRIEELTPNHSFKVYGWTDCAEVADMPFEMRYYPDTKKYSIEAEQNLGEAVIDGKKLAIRLEPLVKNIGDELYILDGYKGRVYYGQILGDRLQFFAQTFKFEGRTFDFTSLAYVGVDEEGNYYRLDLTDVVNFYVNRSASTSSAKPQSVRLVPVKVLSL